jgi:hypothetical protein
MRAEFIKQARSARGGIWGLDISQEGIFGLPILLVDPVGFVFPYQLG